MLKLVLGGSGSGKTTLLYSRIRARAEQGRLEQPLTFDEVLAGEEFFRFYDMQLLSGEWVSAKSEYCQVNTLAAFSRSACVASGFLAVLQASSICSTRIWNSPTCSHRSKA